MDATLVVGARTSLMDYLYVSLLLSIHLRHALDLDKSPESNLLRLSYSKIKKSK